LRKGIFLFATLLLIVAMSLPAVAYDQTGRLGLSYRFGVHSVLKSPWDLRFMHGAEAKFGINPHWMVGVNGVYAATEGAYLNQTKTLPFFDTSNDSTGTLSLRNYIITAGPIYNFTPDKDYNVWVTAGAGIGYYVIRDADGKTVRIPDLNGEMFPLNDTRFTIMLGAGFEYFLVDNFSLGAGLRYYIATTILSQYKGAPNKEPLKKSDALDLPTGLIEFGAVATVYLGKCKDSDHDGVCDDVDQCPDTPKGCEVDENGCPIDTDGDGVCDGLDQCPDTPRCAKVDMNGCPVDTDGDGVWDGCDKCPNTPSGCEVDANGCPLDSDNDGVWDCRDKCPDTPSCCNVDADGCPTDSDNDGVCDGCDECPGTPAGYKVDERGCPTGVPEIQETLSLQGVEGFVVNTWTLTDAFKKILDKVADGLKAFPHVKVEVQGHTDISGTKEWNQTLSERRANSVRDYLISKGVAADRLTAKGYGSSKPKYDNSTPIGRSKNRRVELVRVN